MALALFASKGFGQVSMRELATHLGLTAGSLYHHFPSKQHLLFDLIEEFYDELQAALTLCTRRLRAGGKPLTEVLQAHLALHRAKPLHFRLAERDSRCLSEAQRAHVSVLRDTYEQQLLKVLGLSFSVECRAGAGHAVANLLNSLPGWLEGSALTEPQRTALMENMLGGAIAHLATT